MGLNLKETELSLGLPGGIISNGPNTNGKRGFSETLDLITKHSSCCVDDDEIINTTPNNTNNNNEKEEEELDVGAAVPPPTKPPAAKAQVVGWPPVRSFRKNMISGAGMVKVSMDGAPFLRKVDLKMYSTYQQLSDALAKMFSNHGGRQQQGGMIDFMKESKLVEELSTSSEYVHTYEDKDGDWMLVGDVPWEMFVDSCKRLRIMKGSEAIGLAPRAMEKLCKNKS